MYGTSSQLSGSLRRYSSECGLGGGAAMLTGCGISTVEESARKIEV